MQKIKHYVQNRQIYSCSVKEGRSDFSLKNVMLTVSNREELKDIIFDQLIIPEDQHSTLYKTFWTNSNRNSLRLSKKGFVLLSKTLKLEHFTVLLQEGMGINTGWIILSIDRKMTCPYYLSVTGELSLFGEKERTWLALNDESIVKFIKTWNQDAGY